MAIASSSSVKKSISGDTPGWEWDEMAVFRALAVVLVITFLIIFFVVCKMCRNSNRSRVRRYDVLSSKQLEPILNESEDSEDDELFASIPVVSSS